MGVLSSDIQELSSMGIVKRSLLFRGLSLYVVAVTATVCIGSMCLVRPASARSCPCDVRMTADSMRNDLFGRPTLPPPVGRLPDSTEWEMLEIARDYVLQHDSLARYVFSTDSIPLYVHPESIAFGTEDFENLLPLRYSDAELEACRQRSRWFADGVLYGLDSLSMTNDRLNVLMFGNIDSCYDPNFRIFQAYLIRNEDRARTFKGIIDSDSMLYYDFVFDTAGNLIKATFGWAET